MREAVIVSAVRTPTGKFLGALKGFTAPQLGALVVAEAVRRAGIDPAIVDECIMGNVVSAGLGQNPARQAALRGGLSDHVAALTINKVCGSGLKAVMLAAQGIATGDVDIVVAGGMESMSNCPYLLPRAREGLRLGNGELVDSMINDGLWCAFENVHMGNAGETVAAMYARVAPGAGCLRGAESSQGGGGNRSRRFQRRDSADRGAAEKGRASADRPRRVDSSGHDRRVARQTAARVQAGWLGHRRQCPGRQRRRRRAGRDGCRSSQGARRRPAGANRRAGDQRAAAQAGPDDAGGRRAAPPPEDRLGRAGRRSLRIERSVFGPGGGGHPGARDRSRRE